MVECHGGAWCLSDRTTERLRYEAMASHRIVSIALDFRAVPLDRYFGKRAQFRLDLQSQYDIALVEARKGAEIARRVRPADAA
jgi:plasmid maintenance system antidote protein VapI